MANRLKEMNAYLLDGRHPLRSHSMNHKVASRTIHGERKMRGESNKVQAARAKKIQAQRAEESFQENFPGEQFNTALNALTSMRQHLDLTSIQDYHAVEAYIDKRMHLSGVIYETPSKNAEIVIVEL